MLAVERAANQCCRIQGEQKDARKCIVRFPVMKVPEDWIEAMRLMYPAHKFGSGRQVISHCRELRTIGKPREKLRGITGLSGQIMKPLGESIAARKFGVHR